MLLLGASASIDLERWVRAGYPYETCGVLVGRTRPGVSRVVRAVRLRNRIVERSRDRYELDPGGFVAADRDARADGLAIVGVWHSHPDQPAAPSEADRAAGWAGWSYLILSVSRHALEGRRSWRLVGARFEEEVVATTSRAVLASRRCGTGERRVSSVAGSLLERAPYTRAPCRASATSRSAPDSSSSVWPS
jgi:proteasome lid subunit RPN8/RPN11